MGIKQFIGIKWIDNKPRMLFYNNDEKQLDFEECEGTVYIKKLQEKRCRGYYDLEKKR